MPPPISKIGGKTEYKNITPDGSDKDSLHGGRLSPPYQVNPSFVNGECIPLMDETDVSGEEECANGNRCFDNMVE